jgi:hypothetical protein
MELESLTCNNCGAPLKVPDSANFVKCNHCETQLAIRRTESATFTEKLGEIDKTTDQIKEVVTELARQNRIAAIDREWDREKERYMISGEHGKHLPNETGLIIGGIVFAVIGTIISVAFFAAGGPMGIFPVVILLIGMTIFFVQYNKLAEYREADRRYRQRRAAAAREEVFEDDPTAGGYLKQIENVQDPDEFLDGLGER